TEQLRAKALESHNSDRVTLETRQTASGLDESYRASLRQLVKMVVRLTGAGVSNPDTTGPSVDIVRDNKQPVQVVEAGIVLANRVSSIVSTVELVDADGHVLPKVRDADDEPTGVIVTDWEAFGDDDGYEANWDSLGSTTYMYGGLLEG